MTYDVCFVCSKGMAELDVTHIKTKVYIPIILPFLIAFCLIRDLESLTFLSWFANIIMVIVLVSIYQYLYGHVQRPSELDKFSSWGDLPIFFGTSTYAFEAIAIVSSSYMISLVWKSQLNPHEGLIPQQQTFLRKKLTLQPPKTTIHGSDKRTGRVRNLVLPKQLH